MALMVTELSRPSGLRLLDVAEPSPDGDVVLDVAARGVPFPDLLLTRGAIDPVIAAHYPLAEGARALEDLETRRVRGKSVLAVER